MSQNALLFVGYEPDSGDVVSVAGVRMLGIREAYAPPIRLAPYPMSESPDVRQTLRKCYQRGREAGLSGMSLNEMFARAESLSYGDMNRAMRALCRQSAADGWRDGHARAATSMPQPSQRSYYLGQHAPMSETPVKMMSAADRVAVCAKRRTSGPPYGDALLSCAAEEIGYTGPLDAAVKSEYMALREKRGLTASTSLTALAQVALDVMAAR